MVTKRRPKVLLHSPAEPENAEAETDVETTRSMNVNANVEQTEADASPVIDSVETSEPPPYRTSVEDDRDMESTDIEADPN